MSFEVKLNLRRPPKVFLDHLEANRMIDGGLSLKELGVDVQVCSTDEQFGSEVRITCCGLDIDGNQLFTLAEIYDLMEPLRRVDMFTGSKSNWLEVRYQRDESISISDDVWGNREQTIGESGVLKELANA